MARKTSGGLLLAGAIGLGIAAATAAARPRLQTPPGLSGLAPGGSEYTEIGIQDARFEYDAGIDAHWLHVKVRYEVRCSGGWEWQVGCHYQNRFEVRSKVVWEHADGTGPGGSAIERISMFDNFKEHSFRVGPFRDPPGLMFNVWVHVESVDRTECPAEKCADRVDSRKVQVAIPSYGPPGTTPPSEEPIAGSCAQETPGSIMGPDGVCICPSGTDYDAASSECVPCGVGTRYDATRELGLRCVPIPPAVPDDGDDGNGGNGNGGNGNGNGDVEQACFAGVWCNLPEDERRRNWVTVGLVGVGAVGLFMAMKAGA
jgi:hypothetical protein